MLWHRQVKSEKKEAAAAMYVAPVVTAAAQMALKRDSGVTDGQLKVSATC